MEEKLQRLIEANSPDNRMKWPLEFKKQGKKVVGTLYPSIPEEIIHAGGMLPWRISGLWEDSIPLASAYSLGVSSSYITHVNELYLRGGLDFLDGILTCGWDDDSRGLYDIITYVGRVPISQIMYMPHKKDARCLNLWKDEFRKVVEVLEKVCRNEISYPKLWNSIEVFNTTRSLLSRLYELRKREHPALTGAEMLGIITASMVMPKEEFNKELGALMPYLETRKADLKSMKPRLFLSSNFLDDPRYVKLIEDAGAVVVMEDLDTGSSYFWGKVEVNKGPPLLALARYYLDRPASPHLTDWGGQLQQIIDWVKDFNADGVLVLSLRSCYPATFRLPYLKKRLGEAGIKQMEFEREYQFTNEAQLKLRVGAFIEILKGSK